MCLFFMMIVREDDREGDEKSGQFLSNVILNTDVSRLPVNWAYSVNDQIRTVV